MPDLDFIIHTKKDLISAVNRFGFLPFFNNPIEGFSVEEHCEDDVWYQEDGSWKVWEWKGPVIRECGIAYGKFFGGKAAFVSRKWFPDFANYRRGGYDFEGRYEDGLVSHRDMEMYELINSLNKDDGITIIMITHDISQAMCYASHILHIGKENFFGSKEDYLNSKFGKIFNADEVGKKEEEQKGV